MATFHLIIFFFLLNCNFANSFFDFAPSKSTPRSATPPDVADDIQFDVPDLVTEYPMGDEIVTLETFKVRNRSGHEKPKWVSVGYPSLITNSNGQIFHFTPEHVMVSVKTLDQSQKQALFGQATRQYPTGTVFLENIILLPLIQFACTVHFYVDGMSYDMRGSVYDLRRSPFLLKFPFNQNHRKRYLLQKRLL